ncbi:hypothetical protein LWI29_021642 [Acer saccharum]|uniref:Uncharacterized protein n=1 Tax=Acer saccharum TaxID=4024 RepID=A0AA39S9E9_ACESA|nr:hypothetical protein LWI29_021642 [Acer saccharum]
MLRQEHNRSQAENEMLKEAIRNLLCTKCGSLVAMSGGGGGEIDFEIEKLKLENVRLKDEFNRICMLASKFLGRPFSSSESPIPFPFIKPSDGERTSAPPPPLIGLLQLLENSIVRSLKVFIFKIKAPSSIVEE